MPLFAEEGGELRPLVSRWVDAGGVVGAGVQQDDASFAGGLDGGDHAGKVEPFRLWGEVWVGFDGKMDVCEDLIVVGPGRRREVDWLRVWARVEFGEEEATQMHGAGAGDGLQAYDLVKRR